MLKRGGRSAVIFLAISCFSVMGTALGAAEKEQPAAQAPGQEPAGKEPQRMLSQENQQAMQEMMGSMMGLMMEGMARSMAKPEFAKNMAAFMRNYYKALIEQGFAPEEAMKIVTSSGLPSLGGQR